MVDSKVEGNNLDRVCVSEGPGGGCGRGGGGGGGGAGRGGGGGGGGGGRVHNSVWNMMVKLEPNDGTSLV